MQVTISLRSNERGQRSDLVRGRGGGVSQRLEVGWIRGHGGGGGGEVACSLLRQCRANTSTVGWRVRHRAVGGGGVRVGNYRGPERRGL